MILKSFKYTVAIVTLFSFSAQSAPKISEQIIKKWNCLTLYQKIGVGSVAATVIAVGLMSYGSSKDKKKREIPPPPKKREIPKTAEISINDLLNDRDLYSRSSDLADYLLDKYGEDSKFSMSLSRFVDSYPVEALTALRVRQRLESQRNKTAQELLAEMGPSAHYSLTFAWIITEVYNQKEKAPEKTLRDIIYDIEKSIENSTSSGR